MQEDRINNNAAASPVEVWDGWAQGLEPRGVEAGVAQPLARGFARETGATLTLYDWALRATARALYAPGQGNRIFTGVSASTVNERWKSVFHKAKRPQPQRSRRPLDAIHLSQDAASQNNEMEAASMPYSPPPYLRGLCRCAQLCIVTSVIPIMRSIKFIIVFMLGIEAVFPIEGADGINPSNATTSSAKVAHSNELPLHSAFRVTGLLNVTEYNLKGISNSVITKEFDVTVKDDTWLIKATFAKGHYTVYGCDGTTVYSYLEQETKQSKQTVRPASVTEGAFPLDTSYYVSLPWLAYASAHFIHAYLTNDTINIPAIWAIPLFDPEAFIFQSKPKLSISSPAVPLSLDFEPDPEAISRVINGDCFQAFKPSKSEMDRLKLKLPRYDPKYVGVVAEYRVLSTIEYSGLLLPETFRLTRYWRTRTNSEPKVVQTIFDGKMLKAELVKDFSPKPTCDHVMAVADFRFRDQNPKIQFIRYPVTNSEWLPKDDPKLKKLYEAARAKLPKGIMAYEPAMLFMLLFFAIPGVVFAIRRLRRSRRPETYT